MARRSKMDRRCVLTGVGSVIAAAGVRATSAETSLRFALTPVLLTSDLVMLEELKGYLEGAMGRPVHLVTRRTYQEITALLVSRQVEAAWICGYPFVIRSKEKNEAAARSASLEPTVSVGRALTWVGASDS